MEGVSQTCACLSDGGVARPQTQPVQILPAVPRPKQVVHCRHTPTHVVGVSEYLLREGHLALCDSSPITGCPLSASPVHWCFCGYQGRSCALRPSVLHLHFGHRLDASDTSYGSHGGWAASFCPRDRAAPQDVQRLPITGDPLILQSVNSYYHAPLS
jgi:hypothetical protein